MRPMPVWRAVAATAGLVAEEGSSAQLNVKF